jgi:hypothetical protein
MNPSKIRERKCSTCKHYQPSPLWRKGWCRNPLLYDRNTNHLVEADSLACNRTFIDYWEPISGPIANSVARASGGKPRIAPSIPMDTLDAKGNRVTHTGLTPMSGMTAIAPDLHQDAHNNTGQAVPIDPENEYGSRNGQHTLEFTQIDSAPSSNGTLAHDITGPHAAKTRAEVLKKAARPPQKPILLGMGRDRLILMAALLIVLVAVIGGSIWLATRKSGPNLPAVLPTVTLSPKPSPTGFGDPTATLPPAPTATPLPLPPAGTIGVNGWVKATQNVRLRDQASTSGKIVSVLQTDKIAHVIDGPVDANGYTWWKVDQYDPNNPTASGWCAGEFLNATAAPAP